jgi:hypothetical protein
MILRQLCKEQRDDTGARTDHAGTPFDTQKAHFLAVLSDNNTIVSRH